MSSITNLVHSNPTFRFSSRGWLFPLFASVLFLAVFAGQAIATTQVYQNTTLGDGADNNTITRTITVNPGDFPPGEVVFNVIAQVGFAKIDDAGGGVGRCNPINPGGGNENFPQAFQSLTSPLATNVVLFPAGTYTATNTIFPGVATVTFNQSAGSVVGGSTPSTGTFRPTGNLNDFDGQDPTGVWTLTLGDNAANDPHCFSSLSLTIRTLSVPGTPDLVSGDDSGSSNTDNVTNENQPEFTVTCDPNATVQIREGSIVLGSGTCGGSGTVSITSSTLSDGDHLITARAVDGPHITADSPALLVTIDTIDPATVNAPDLQAASDTGVSSTDNITNINTPTFDVVGCTDGLLVQLRESVLVRGSATCSGGVAVITSASLSNGNHSLDARQIDLAGNFSTDSASLTVTIDTNAPSTPGVPNLTNASDSGASQFDNITNVLSPSFTVNCTGSNFVSILLDGSIPFGTETCSGGSATITGGPIDTDGDHTFSAFQMDTAGNQSGTSGSLTVTFDSVAPDAPIAPDLLASSDSGVDDTDNLTNDNEPTFDLYCDNSDFIDLVGDTVLGSGSCSGNPVQITSSLLLDGEYSIRAQQRDIAGNLSPESEPITVTIDTIVPAPGTPDLIDSSDTGASAFDNVTSIDSPNFSVGCEPDALVVLFDGATPVQADTCDMTSLIILQSSSLFDGTHSFSAQQSDRAGNLSGNSGSLSVVIDTGVPTAPARPDLLAVDDHGLSDTDNITNTENLHFSIGCTTGVVTLFEEATILGTGNCSAGTVTIAATLSEGTHSVAAYQTDLAGNTGQNGLALSVTVDLTPPVAGGTPDLVAPSDSGRFDDDDVTNVTTPDFDVSCAEEGTLVEIHDGSGLLGGALCVSELAKITSSALSEDVHDVFSRVTDVAGNISDDSSSLAVTIDVTPPAGSGVPDLQADSDTGANDTDDLTGDNTPTFDVSCTESDSSVTIFEGTEDLGSGLCDGSTAAVTASTLSDGTHHIGSREVDLAGNASGDSSTLSIEIDTSPNGLSGTPDLVDDDDTGISNTDNLTSVNTPEFSISCTVDGNTVQLVEESTVLGDGICSGGTVLIQSSLLSDGEHTVFSRQIDDLENVSADSDSLVVTIDTLAPAVPVILIPEEGEVVETDTPAFSGTGEADSTVTVFFGVTSLGSSAVSSGGAWGFTTGVSLADGPTSVTASAIDLAGNQSVASSARNFIVDDDSDGDGLLNSEEGGTDDADGDGIINALDPDSHNSSVISNSYVVPWNGFNNQVSIGEGRNNLSNKTILLRVTMRDRSGNNHEVFPMFVAPNGQSDVNLNALDGFSLNDYGTALFEGFEVDGITPLQPGDFDGQVSVYRLEGNTFENFDYAYAIPFSGFRSGTLVASYNTNHPSLDPNESSFRVANFGEASNFENFLVSGNLFFFGQNGEPVEISPGVFNFPVVLLANERQDISIHDIVGPNRVGMTVFVPDVGFETARIGLRVNRYFFRNSTFSTSGPNAFAGVVSVEGVRGRSGPIVLPMDTSAATTAIGEIGNALSIPINITVQAFDKDGNMKKSVSQPLGSHATLHEIGDLLFNGGVGYFVISTDTPGSLYATVVHYSRLPTASVWSARALRGSDPIGAPLFGSLNSFLSQSCRVTVSNSGSSAEVVDLARFDLNGVQIGTPLEIPLAANGSASSNICNGFPSNTYGKFQILPRNRQAKISAGATRDQVDYNMATEVRG